MLASLLFSCTPAEDQGTHIKHTAITKEVNADSLASTPKKPTKSVTPFVFENTSWINEDCYQCLQEKHSWSECKNTAVLIAESANQLKTYQNQTSLNILLQPETDTALGQRIHSISGLEKFNYQKKKGIEFDAVYLKKMPERNRLMLTYKKGNKSTHSELLMPCASTIANLPLQGTYILNDRPVIFSDNQVKGMLGYQSYYLVKAMSSDEKNTYNLLILYPNKDISASAETREGYGFYILKDLDKGFALYQPDFEFDSSGWDLSEGYLFSGYVLTEGELAFSFRNAL